MEELYHELHSLRGKLLNVTDPNERWEIEIEIANIREQIEEGYASWE